MLILSQFVLRLSFGLALAMAFTSPWKVSSGFFRNHSYVLLGLNVLAMLAALSSGGQLPWWQPLIAAVLCYACAIAMLYERTSLGVRILALVAALSLTDAIVTQTLSIAGGVPAPIVDSALSDGVKTLWGFNAVSSGMLLGFTIAAMFLGHWYLNTPEMELRPLRRLLMLMALAVILRAVCSGSGLVLATARPRAVVNAIHSGGLALDRRNFWHGGIGGNVVANAENSQHAKRHRNSLRRRHHHVSGGIDQPATVTRHGVSFMIDR